MPVPANWVEIESSTQEYRDVLASIVQPEEFIYNAEWGEPVHDFLYTDAQGIKWRYIHRPGCMMYKWPIQIDPPIEA